MGLINDLKKIFFAAESVSKSAAEKTGDFLEENVIEQGKKLASEATENLAEKTASLKDIALEKMESLEETAKKGYESLSDKVSTNETLQDLGETVEGLGKSVKEKGGEALDKFGEVAENVGGKVMEHGGEALEKFGEVAENVGGKILDKGKVVAGTLGDKFEEVSEDIKEKFDDTMDKAETWAAEEAKKPKQDYATEDLDADGSLLENTDDFFSKADQFADGNYKSFSEGEVTLDKPTLELPKADPSKAAGFEDLDGDGNELIDDATIEE